MLKLAGPLTSRLYINISSEQRSISPLQNTHSPKDAFLSPSHFVPNTSPKYCFNLISLYPSLLWHIHVPPCSCILGLELLLAQWNTWQSWKPLLHTRSITRIGALYINAVPICAIFLPCSAGRTLLLHFGQQHQHWIISKRDTSQGLIGHRHFASCSLTIVMIEWKWTKCRKRLQKPVWRELFFLEGILEELRLFRLAKWRGTAMGKGKGGYVCSLLNIN